MGEPPAASAAVRDALSDAVDCCKELAESALNSLGESLQCEADEEPAECTQDMSIEEAQKWFGGFTTSAEFERLADEEAAEVEHITAAAAVLDSALEAFVNQEL